MKSRKAQYGNKNICGANVERIRKQIRMKQSTLVARMQLDGVDINPSSLSKLEGQMQSRIGSRSFLCYRIVMRGNQETGKALDGSLSFTQLSATAIKHKFIGLPVKILTFHTKNTPVHWGKNHPIKQEYSLVRRKKFIGTKTAFYTCQSHLHCISTRNKKAENLLRRNQKLATSLDFN